MAVIVDGGNIAGGLSVSAISKAARSELFTASGSKLSRLSGEAISPTDESLLISGSNEGNSRVLRVDRLGHLISANATMLLTDSFEGATLAPQRWAAITTGMQAVQTAAAGIRFNSTALTTASNGYGIRSSRPFAKMQRSSLHLRARAKIDQITNSQVEIGFGDYTTATGPHINGAYWQYTPGGVVQPVLCYNSQEITGPAVSGLSPTIFYAWDIVVEDDSILYTIQDTSSATTVAERTIQLPATQPKFFGATRLFAFARLFNTATAPASPASVMVTLFDVWLLEANTSKPWAEQMAGSGYGAAFSPVNFAIAANTTNNTAPATAALSNSVPGYTTLGGYYQFAAVAGANTDYCLFGFVAPSPYSFICLGVDIETWNTGAVVTTTPTLLVWSLAHDLAAANLANTGARPMVGAQDFPVGAPIGARAASISKNFHVPLITNPGKALSVALRMPVASATAAQIIQGAVTLRGYFD